MFVITCKRCGVRFNAVPMPRQQGRGRIHPSVTMAQSVAECPDCNGEWALMISKKREPWRLRLKLWLAALLLTGCTVEHGPPSVIQHGEVETVLQAPLNQREAAIQEFKLADGTQCVALVGYGNSALSCDWQPVH